WKQEFSLIQAIQSLIFMTIMKLFGRDKFSNKHVTMTNLSSPKILTIKNTQFFTLRMPYQLSTKNQSPTKLKIVFKIENDSRKFPRVIFYFDKNLNDHQQFWLSHFQAVQLMNQHRS